MTKEQAEAYINACAGSYDWREGLRTHEITVNDLMGQIYNLIQRNPDPHSNWSANLTTIETVLNNAL